MGPNSKIAMVMRRYMHEYGATLDHFAKIAVAGRYHASLNPLAYLRKPITVEDYKESRLVADPVRLLDCVMPANGGRAYIVASPERAQVAAQKTDLPEGLRRTEQSFLRTACRFRRAGHGR
jgi:acetyl-CoA acetyltransferase